jgi:hypothetical protein
MRKNWKRWRAGRATFREAIDSGRVTVAQLERVIELHAAMLGRARRAIDCWSMAGWRLRVVKDMRVVIAKMAWEEVWRLGEMMEVKREDRQKVRQKKKSKKRL